VAQEDRLAASNNAKEVYLDSVKVLLNYGADINSKIPNRHNNTIIILAVHQNANEFERLLLV